ncbi:ribonuclease J [Mycoplasmoides pirum]|uniref:ribonuclease J n=1 Tax=Mycoplasmoides pirum TaxID=2122 RepID=UPI00048A332B|nr:ribonuclease J [Mycoplasmoides pirum]
MINEIDQSVLVKEPTKIYAFGGLDEIGKNMYGIEYKDEIVVIDCGIKFAHEELLGIDGIVANFEYLKKNAEKLKAVVITHGHEDHIGGIPYLLKEVEVPVIYAPKIASEFIMRKLQEHKDAKPTEIVVYDDFSIFKTKHFTIDFYRVNHSVPDSFGVCVQTPNGNIVESGDYRFDFAARNEELDMQKVVEISNRGVDLFMTETTNAEVNGFSSSEQDIYKNINKIISEAPGRVIMTTFASNTTRINEVIEIALNKDRKICLLGKAMEANVTTSRKVGYINIKETDLISPRELKKYEDQNIIIFCTGSQGEELAALNVMARGKHSWVSLKPTDTIIMSSNPIPGNYANVEHLLNELYKHGVIIYENSPSLRLHASGHATRQELQLMLRLVNPKYVMPIHGEYKMFSKIKKIASEVGIDKENVVIAKNGDMLYLIDHELYYSDQFFNSDSVYIEGHATSNNSAKILKERKILSEDGIFTIILLINKKKFDIINLPIVITRGCFFAKESAALVTKMTHVIKQAVKEELRKQSNNEKNKEINYSSISDLASNIANHYIWRNKRRNPLIKTIIEEI